MVEFANLKRSLKKKYGAWISRRKVLAEEKREYQRELHKQVKVARREAFTREAVKQAKVRARVIAKQKFGPKPKSKVAGGSSWQSGLQRAINFDEGMGLSFPKPKKISQGKKTIKEFDPFVNVMK